MLTQHTRLIKTPDAGNALQRRLKNGSDRSIYSPSSVATSHTRSISNHGEGSFPVRSRSSHCLLHSEAGFRVTLSIRAARIPSHEKRHPLAIEYIYKLYYIKYSLTSSYYTLRCLSSSRSRLCYLATIPAAVSSTDVYTGFGTESTIHHQFSLILTSFRLSIRPG